MVHSTRGAVGAAFLDHQGEAVELVASGLEPYDVQVIGAYQGIFLGQLEELCRRLDGGTPLRTKFSWESFSLLNTVVDDGYYVVLVLADSAHEGLAWQRLEECRKRILEEIG
ncbi:MAG: hypothetical protein WBX15_18490 [Thermoanaerobaculia bacterium]